MPKTTISTPKSAPRRSSCRMPRATYVRPLRHAPRAQTHAQVAATCRQSKTLHHQCQSVSRSQTSSARRAQIPVAAHTACFEHAWAVATAPGTASPRARRARDTPLPPRATRGSTDPCRDQVLCNLLLLERRDGLLKVADLLLDPLPLPLLLNAGKGPGYTLGAAGEEAARLRKRN